VNKKSVNLQIFASEARALLTQLEQNTTQDKDFTLLSVINALSSGSYYSRALGAKIGTPEYAKALQNTKNLTAFLSLESSIAQGAW
jgi:hypothetical protein